MSFPEFDVQNTNSKSEKNKMFFTSYVQEDKIENNHRKLNSPMDSK